MQKGFWLVVVLAVVGMFGLFALTSEESTNASFENYDPTKLQLIDHIDGVNATTQEELDAAAEGKVVVIEYGDFQCPACQVFSSVMDQIKLDFADEIIVAYRNFPLTTIHPQAMAAHRAAEAAALQGMFWEMHDALYARQSQWSGVSNASDVMEILAQDLSLDLEKFNEDRDSTTVFDRIDVDRDSASDTFDISATPSLVINGELLDSTPSYDALTTILEEEIAALNSAE